MSAPRRLPALDPREEERQAREKQRRLERLQREAQRYRAQDERTTRTAVIRRELARPRAKACKCGITVRTTRAELVALGEGCTGRHRGGPGWVCPVLDAIRRGLRL